MVPHDQFRQRGTVVVPTMPRAIVSAALAVTAPTYVPCRAGGGAPARTPRQRRLAQPGPQRRWPCGQQWPLPAQ
ncbi:hypothetical protein LP419_20130 [Massilia sp. H-1]|nr:hypothetical protein LP419_20130 [Massilia sp. H-1]